MLDGKRLGTESISKSFGYQTVLRDLTLGFAAGDIALLLGPNGAGKSTLLRILAGLTRPDRGTVHRDKLESIGFVSHQLFLYGSLTVRENLRLFAAAASLGDVQVEAALETWDLGAHRSKKVSELSKGLQVRCALARALLGTPSVLLLDEPSSNLDEPSTQMLRDSVKQLARSRNGETVIVIATHDIHRLRTTANRVVVIDGGKVAEDSGRAGVSGSLDAVIDAYHARNR